MNSKICSRCKITKPICDFTKNKSNPDGLNYYCTGCKSELYYEYKKKYPERIKQYISRAHKMQIGLTEKQYDELYQKQKGGCAICGLEETDKNQHGVKRLAIDHDHNTTMVRGLLCAKCNRALGLLDVDNRGALILQRAIEYLLEAA